MVSKSLIRRFRPKHSNEAVQYDGTNGKGIANWVKLSGFVARPGGGWIKYQNGAGETRTARKGDWLVKRDNGSFFHVSDREFNRLFAPVKTRAAK